MYASDHNNTETKRFRSQRQRQQQQQTFFYLVEEVIIEILSWLPVESLIRFKCVSKSWNSLISNPSFIQLHFLRSSKLPHRHFIVLTTLQHKTTFAASYASFHALTHFLQNPSSSPSSSSDQQHLLRLNGSYTILGSCNGLVCLLHYQLGQEDFHFMFWNPATRLVSQILQGFTKAKPTRCCFKFGFGYDKFSDTYKLVALRFDYFALKDSDRTQVKVYTFGSGSGQSHCWREIQRFPEFPLNSQVEGIFLSGTLNWVAMRNFVTGPVINWADVTIDKYVIVSLDLGNETYNLISLPSFGRDEMPDEPLKFDPVIEVFLDCLCLSYDYKRTHFVMWQMKAFGVEKSWTRFVNISYQHLQIELLPSFFIVPLCISENGDTLILRNNYSEIILYNRRDNGVQRSNKNLEIYVKGHVQSLISPC